MDQKIEACVFKKSLQSFEPLSNLLHVWMSRQLGQMTNGFCGDYNLHKTIFYQNTSHTGPFISQPDFWKKKSSLTNLDFCLVPYLDFFQVYSINSAIIQGGEKKINVCRTWFFFQKSRCRLKGRGCDVLW